MAIFKHCPTLIMLIFQLICMSILACALSSANITNSTGSNAKFAKPDVTDSHWRQVPHEYGVYFYDNHTLDKHWEHIGRELPISRHPEVLNSYQIKFSDTDARLPISAETETIRLIRSDPNVELVSEKYWQQLWLGEETIVAHPATPEFISSHQNNSRWLTEVRQPNAPWPLTHISSVIKNTRDTDYTFIQSAGAGVNVYVLDTGLSRDLHDTDPMRYRYGANFIGSEDEEDENGHGTYVAGLVGSAVFGVCKFCNVISVKVGTYDGNIDSEAVAYALDWVVADHEKRKHDSGWKGSIINMSFQVTEKNNNDINPVRKAVGRVYDAGIPMVAAAGNSGMSAATSGAYPGNSYKVISVAASRESYGFWEDSNWGYNINVIAPGVNVMSYTLRGNVKLGNGTSAAAPHVAGVIAVWMSHEGHMDHETAQSRVFANSRLDYMQDVPKEQINSYLNNGIKTHNPYVDAPRDELRLED